MASLSELLRERGFRITLQRQIILDVLQSLSGHFTAEDIYGRFKERFPQVNVSTVYRTLELLEQAGLATHTHFDDGIAKWHLSEVGPHQHLVCRVCGREEEMDLEVVMPLARDLESRYGFHSDVGHFAIVGLCRACWQAAEQPDQR